MELDYERDVTIDGNALEVEWLDQAKRVLDYSRHSAECQKEVSILKDALKETKARIGKDVRANPSEYNIEKVTNDTVEEAVLLDKDYKKAQKELIEAEFEAEIAKGAVEAFRHRKGALENLVQLFMAQYFAGPKVPRDLSKEWEEKQRQKSSNASVRIERTRTRTR